MEALDFKWWQWVLVTAARVGDTTQTKITSKLHTQRLGAIRRAVYLFLDDIGWKTRQIADLMNREPFPVTSSIGDGTIQQGTLTATVYGALQKEWKVKAPTLGQVERACPNPASADTLLRVVYRMVGHNVPAHYEIAPVRGGRSLMIRRMDVTPESSALFGDDPDKACYYRIASMPDYLGGQALIPATENDWLKMGGYQKAERIYA